MLREYALLADGERGAVVGPRGDIVWMCAPRWDSDAVFTSLIGGAGEYTVTPAGRYVWGGYYEDGSMIWRSRWVTDAGIVECRERRAPSALDRRCGRPPPTQPAGPAARQDGYAVSTIESAARCPSPAGPDL